MTTYGFIGAGNMATAIISGMVEAGTDPADIVISDAAAPARKAAAKATGVHAVETNDEVVAAADVLVLAVKPHIVPLVLPPLRAALEDHRPLVVCIAAGTTLDKLADLTPEGTRLVRVMPNVNAMVGAGMAAVCGNVHATKKDVQQVVELFETVGQATEMAEADFSAFTALAGSSPAFVFTFIDALARGGVANGIPKPQAVQIAAQAVLGSARMVLERADRGVTPADLVDMVSSPAGTTVAGTIAMEDAGFTPAVVRGVQAVVDRDQSM